MKMKITLLLLAFFAPTLAFATTTVPTIINADTTWEATGNPYFAYDFSIASGVTLTVNPGVIVKFYQSSSSITVDGVLKVQGESAHPVYFTAFNDTTVGDTGYSQWGATWAGVKVNPGASVQLYNINIANVEYSRSGITNQGGILSVSNSKISSIFGGDGISHSSGTTTVSSTVFDNNSYGVYGTGTGTLSLKNNIFSNNQRGPAYFNLSQGLIFTNSNNTATGTGRKGFFVFSDGSSTMSNQVWAGSNISYVVDIFGVTIPSGKTLTINPGAVVKFEQNNASITVNGTLNVAGSSIAPAYFTSLNDDAVGGDSDNGSTSSYINQWAGININSGAVVNIKYAILRKGGYFGTCLQNIGGKLTISNSTITNSAMAIVSSDGITNISQSSIYDNSGVGVYRNSGIAILAKNNWWGSPTGPTHSTNPLGTGQRVSDGVTFLPFLTTDPNVPLSLSNDGESEDDNNQDTKGVASLTKFTFTANLLGTAVPATWVKLNVLAEGQTVPSIYNVPLPNKSLTSSFTLTFKKGKYTYYFTAKSGLKTLTSVKKTFTTGYSNVAFLPGLEASRLRRIDTNVRIWEPQVGHDNTQLYMNSDGTSVKNYIVTEGLIDNAYVLNKGNVYFSLLRWLTALVNQKIVNDAKVFPYDWRYSVEDIVNKPVHISGGSYMLLDDIKSLASTSDTGKVTIVAHSNGGLITKVLSNKLGEDAPKILDQIIFVAVPQVGTPKAVGAILHGFDQGVPFERLPLVITPAEARILSQNMPSAYGLLPSASYFSSVTDPVIVFSTTSPILAPWRLKYGSSINTSEGLQKFMTDAVGKNLPVTNIINRPATGNTVLYQKAVDLHSSLDTWEPPLGVRLTEIAGFGIETLRTITYSQDANGKLIYTPTISALGSAVTADGAIKMTMDGDGTVVVPSALWTAKPSVSNKYWVDLYSYDTNYTFQRKHADILEVPQLRTFIQNIIIRSTVMPQYIWAYTPPTTFATDKRLHFILHSPLALSIYDSKGNHTGVLDNLSDIEESIPGSYYETFGEVQYISVPADTDLKLLMKGYKKGTFTLEIEEVQGNTLLSNSKFSGIPSNEKTIVTMDIPKGKTEETQTLPSSKSPSRQNSKALVATDASTASLNLSVDMDGNGKRKMNLKMKKNEMVVMDKETVKTFAKDIKDAKIEEDKENTVNQGLEVI